MFVLTNKFSDYSFTGEANTPVLSTTLLYMSYYGDGNLKRIIWSDLQLLLKLHFFPKKPTLKISPLGGGGGVPEFLFTPNRIFVVRQNPMQNFGTLQ
jgi:hypothetical protein